MSSLDTVSTDATTSRQRQYAQARGGGALDLLIEGAVRRGAEPARHGVGADCVQRGRRVVDCVRPGAMRGVPGASRARCGG
jgi:hypothetical protein